ncbi:hypothetical protein FBR02_04395 [Anaerolineae bacterium CFX9]|nr:hypothetical protein [Anaerolineae bacterium CFX9]
MSPRILLIVIILLTTAFRLSAQDALPAFPGAEGFGAIATGGRGGQVITVTTLNAEGEGSLQAALDTPGPRTIVFAVSGVIPAAARIRYGDVTIAGQTSPQGITVRGIVCDGHYEVDDCRNVIIQHLRSRPAPHLMPAEGYYDALDDALRIDGAREIMIDHLSLANATDEAVQISMASSVTIQNTIIAETIGDHHRLGGMLINYSHSQSPQDDLSIHHNLWYRITERLPELSCELTRGFGDDDSVEIPSFCGQQPLNIELSNNLYWDPDRTITYGDNDAGGYGQPEAGRFLLRLNWVNNLYMARADFTHGMILDSVPGQPDNVIYARGNRINLYPQYEDMQLAYCCNDFDRYHPVETPIRAAMQDERLPFPPITYTETDALIDYMIANAGAFPALRDAMDTRFMEEVALGEVLPLERGVAGANDAFEVAGAVIPPPADSDGDGMPDAWEAAHGLDPQQPDQNGVAASGYTHLETYLHERAREVEGR